MNANTLLISLLCATTLLLTVPLYSSKSSETNNVDDLHLLKIQKKISEAQSTQLILTLLSKSCVLALEKAEAEKKLFAHELAENEGRKKVMRYSLCTKEEKRFLDTYMKIKTECSDHYDCCNVSLPDRAIIQNFSQNKNNNIALPAKNLLALILTGDLNKKTEQLSVDCTELLCKLMIEIEKENNIKINKTTVKLCRFLCPTLFNIAHLFNSNLTRYRCEKTQKKEPTVALNDLLAAKTTNYKKAIASLCDEKKHTSYNPRAPQNKNPDSPIVLIVTNYFIPDTERILKYLQNLAKWTNQVKEKMPYVGLLKKASDETLTIINTAFTTRLQKSPSSPKKKKPKLFVSPAPLIIEDNSKSEQETKTPASPSADMLKRPLPYIDLHRRVSLWFNDPDTAIAEGGYDTTRSTAWLKIIHRFTRTVDVFIESLGQQILWGNDENTLSYSVPGMIIHEGTTIFGHFTFGVGNAKGTSKRLYHRCFMECDKKNLTTISKDLFKKFHAETHKNMTDTEEMKQMPQWRAQYGDTVTDRETHIEIQDQDNNIIIRLFKSI